MHTDLDVYMNGQHTATITTDHILTYTDNWKENHPNYPLSLALPTDTKNKKVSHVLAGLIPENQTTLSRMSAPFHLRKPFNQFNILAALGHDTVGAAQYIPRGEDPSQLHDERLIPLDDALLARIINDYRNDAYSPLLDNHRIALAGQQPKFALHRGDDGSWSIPFSGTPTTHIFKPSPTTISDTELIELAMQNSARKLGIPAARCSVEEFNGQRVFISERFDRRQKADGTIERIHQEDFLQALGRHPNVKYQKSNGGPSLIDIFNLINKVATDKSLQTFIRMLAFNIGVGNADAHAKNYSFVIEPNGTVTIAPAYDLLSLAPFYDMFSQTLSMSIGRCWNYRQVSTDDWVYLARKTKTDPDFMLATVKDVWKDLPQVVEEECGNLPMSDHSYASILDTVESTTNRI